MSTRQVTQRITAATILALGAFAAGCGDSTDPGHEEPEVVEMDLSIGGTTVTILDNGTIEGGPIELDGDGLLEAVFLDADGDDIELDDDFELRVESGDESVVTFTRTGQFTGTIEVVSSGNTTLTIELYHLVEQHADFGPFSVPITVN